MPQHRRHELTTRALAVIFLLYRSACYPAGAEHSDWLNVKDCGASGSRFETRASATAGSKQVTVADVGDFAVGQGVIVSKCNVHYPRARLWAAMYDRKPLGDAMEIRGYDGSGGGWLAFVIDIQTETPPTFRWSDDVGKTWKGTRVAITHNWQRLCAGVEVRFGKREWKPGNVVTFDARDGLVSTIEKIEGKVLTLKHAASQTVTDAVVRHEDTTALQAAIKQAIKETRNVYFPVGHYRLMRSLTVADAEGIRIEGASGVHTVLDISQGLGSCIRLSFGGRVTIRNLRMLGNGGAEEGKPRTFRTSGGYSIWRMHMKPSNAVSIRGTEHTLVENVHASKMSCECFYAQGPGRRGAKAPKQYAKSITYLRCSVTDCGFNAFNNNDMSESTSVLYCRVENINNCFWEGPGRFIRLIGNYVRDGGVMAVGNMFHRYEWLHDLGIAQTIVADNVFEGTSVNRSAINVQHCANQVVIRNNLFINYGSNAICLNSADKADFAQPPGTQAKSSFPAGNVTVTGNIIDLTYHNDKARRRTGIHVGLSDAIVSDNQIYVRGDRDDRVNGITIREPAINVNVHNNLIRNCNNGITTHRVRAFVGAVAGPRAFLRRGRALPLEWRHSHLYRGWNLLWLTGARPMTMSNIERWDPDTLEFKLAEPHDMKAGDAFEVFPRSANWHIHDNTIVGCAQPVRLESHGSSTSVFRNNVITRGQIEGVKQAVVVAGRFQFIGNHISGFDEKDSAALVLLPDRLGKPPQSLYRGNIIERCACAVDEAAKGLWEAAATDGNQFIQCGSELRQAMTLMSAHPSSFTPAKRPTFTAPKLGKPIKIDGKVEEWPWQDTTRVIKLEWSPTGDRITSPTARACAARADTHLYLALRCKVRKAAKLVPSLHWGGDGVEISFRDPKPDTPNCIFMLWSTVDGTFNSTTQNGATPDQVSILEKHTSFAAQIAAEEWTGEWRIPLGKLGLKPANARPLNFSIGVRSVADDCWVAWTPTGGAIYQVDQAGELRFEQAP